MKKVLSFGEALLRFTPDAGGNWIGEHALPVFIGGAELNVATALALWNIPVKYLTALPQNQLSETLLDYMQKLKIDTSAIVKSGDRIGTFYLTKGKDMKNDAVIYDRSHSSYAELKPGMIDWDKALADVDWFHFSAICPALTQNVADVCLEAVKAASAKNIRISLDLNYRSKLWKYGKEPIEIVPQLAKYAHLIMGNIWAAEQMLGIKIDEDLIAERTKPNLLEQAERTSRKVIEEFEHCEAMANTFRFDKGEGISYYTTLYKDDALLVSNEYSADKITDKVGSGDCFMAGLIYGFQNKLDGKQTLEFATAAAFDKLFIPSDATKSTVDDVKKRMKNGK